MTIMSRTQLLDLTNQIGAATARGSNTPQRVGDAMGGIVESMQMRGEDGQNGLDVTAFGALAGGAAADNVTALTTAVAAAVAQAAFLYWPAGNYDTNASVPLLHTVRHRGPGFIKRGTDYFAVENVQASNNTNRLYVATTGSAGNDGLSSAEPMATPQGAFTALKNYGPVLDGTWKVIFAAGTYTVHSQTYDVPSKDWVTIQGPSVGGHPNVPTAIFDGSGFAANQHGFVIGTGGGGTGIKAWFQDIKCQDYNAGSQNSCGWSQGYGARCIYVNCHADNCDFAGILADQGDICLVSGGIINACRDGVVLNATKGTVGYQGSALGNSTRITACTEFGVFWSRGAQGHCDYVFFDQNAIALRIESAARSHVMGCDFRRSTTAAVSTNTDGSWYEDVSVVNAFNDGTGNANTKRYFTGAYSGKQQNWTDTGVSEFRVYMDDTARTLTNAAKTQIGADVYTLPVSYFVDNKSKIRIKVFGDTPADVTSIGIDFFNAGPGVKVMDYSAFVGTPAAGGFIYECEVFPLTSATQRVFGKAEGSTIAPRIQNGAGTADMSLAQVIRLMGQSATGTITVRRIEVWVTG